MTLRDGIEFVRRLEKELCIFNTEPDDPIAERLATLFETQNVTITTEQTSSGAPEIAALSDRNGVLTVLPVSALRALADHSSAQTAATTGADTAHDEILAHLKETTFTSYDSEQLLYASREIEDRARRVGGGTIHAGFQRTSTIADQQSIYTDLATRGVTVHAYGIPDASSPDLATGHVHAVDTEEIATMWFVIFDGGDNPAQKSALVAKERTKNDFYGAWTYDATIVDHLCAYLDRTYLSGTQSTDSPDPSK